MTDHSVDLTDVCSVERDPRPYTIVLWTVDGDRINLKELGSASAAAVEAAAIARAVLSWREAK